MGRSALAQSLLRVSGSCRDYLWWPELELLSA